MSADAAGGRLDTTRGLGGPDRRRWGRFPPSATVAVLAVLALVAVVVFMTIEARGAWSFIIPFRGRKVLGMALVGTAIAASTVMFQTITNNRILTPSIMGFDALYMLIQTVAVYTFGVATFAIVDRNLMFVIEVAVMIAFSGALFYLLFVVGQRSLHLLVLVGIVFGVMIRSLTNLLQRVMDPLAFAVLQDAGFASFNAIDRTLLLISSIIVVAVLVAMWRMRFTLDILALGRDMAINLGVNYQRSVMLVLAGITALVSVSTALVGPITFFGLLVANLAYALVRSYRHRVIIPAAALLATITLVAGQTVLERVFQFDTSLSVIIEFAGGLLFIYLLVRGVVR
ncbi:MAG TPA: iron chelate uptake ABC transporter family permease subunit [Trueperaceae bacterium]|nr:iron chelate uptake ABC transporter family permease subunit [Trueperaceae bacterium]